MEEAAAAQAADGRDAFRMRSASEDPESQLSNAETHASPASAAATDDSPAKGEDARAAGSTPQRTHAAAELGSLSVQAAAPQRADADLRALTQTGALEAAASLADAPPDDEAETLQRLLSNHREIKVVRRPGCAVCRSTQTELKSMPYCSHAVLCESCYGKMSARLATYGDDDACRRLCYAYCPTCKDSE